MKPTTLITYDRWQSRADNKVCARRKALHGRIFRRDQGPKPPLHPHCRCSRIFHGIQPDDSPPPMIPVLPPILVDGNDWIIPDFELPEDEER